MQRRQCSCPVTTFQQISSQLEQDKIPIDKILMLGSEFTCRLEALMQCERCLGTQRVTDMLIRITSRLVCFYEASHANASGRQWSTGGTPSSPAASFAAAAPPPQSTSSISATSSRSQQSSRSHNRSNNTFSDTSGDDDAGGYKCLSRPMKLGNLTLHGSEAQLLGQVVLMDACLDLTERLQEWKITLDEKWDETARDDMHNEVLTKCLDRLAQLTGRLHFGAVSGEALG